jgi:hypothetical protein
VSLVIRDGHTDSGRGRIAMESSGSPSTKQGIRGIDGDIDSICLRPRSFSCCYRRSRLDLTDKIDLD